MIGLGVGRGTTKLSTYYPNSLVDIEVKQMATKLADLIRDVIEAYDQY